MKSSTLPNEVVGIKPVARAWMPKILLAQEEISLPANGLILSGRITATVLAVCCELS